MASEKNKKTSPTSTLSVLEYAGHRVLEIQFRGKRCWILAHVEAALDYESTALGTLIRKKWSCEFAEGKHFDVVRGQDLKDLRSVLDPTIRGMVPSKTSQVTVLYESGLDLVILKTEKPQGQELRRVLVDHVIPQLRETGSATLPGAPAAAIDMEALAKAVAAQLSPQLAEIQSSFTAQSLLNPRFRMATIQHKVQACVEVAMRISPNPRVGRSKKLSKNPAKTYSATIYAWLRGVSEFGVTGCRWDGAPLDTFMKAVAALDGMMSILQKFSGGVLPIDPRQMQMFKGSN